MKLCNESPTSLTQKVSEYIILLLELSMSCSISLQFCVRNNVGVVLVTDAIAAAGLVEGVHQLGRLAVDVKYVNPKDPKRRRGSAQLAGTCTLAGR